MRVIVICLLLLAALFAGHSIYDRVMAERKLGIAVRMLPNDPAGSYKTMKEVLSYNRLVALGKIGAVQQEYLQTLERRIILALSVQAPEPEIYSAVGQAIGVLDELGRQTGINPKEIRIRLIHAARDSVPSLKEHGTLKAWDNMTAIFQDLGTNPTYTTEAFDNFNKWFDEVKAVPRRPIGLRDAIRDATAALNQTLALFQLKPAEAGQAPVAPAPPALSDKQLIAAENGFNNGFGVIATFQNLFGEQAAPPELAGLAGILAYNIAAIKLAHFQDHKGTIYQTGSDYLAEFLIRSDTDAVPTTGEMVDTWRQKAEEQFQAARDYFARAETLSEPMRRAYGALALWSQGLMHTVLSPGATSELNARAMQAAYGLSGPAATVAQAMQASPRALLVVGTP